MNDQGNGNYRTLLSALLLLALASPVCVAQYFGQNKVRFKNMDFRVLQTKHFDIYYYPQEKDATELAGRMAERWYTRLSSVLHHELPPHQPIILYDSSPAFRATTVIPGRISIGVGGVTEPLRRRVVMPFAGPLAETDHVLGHELVHAFQYDMSSGPKNAPAGGRSGAESLPLWFIEGMAEYLSLGPVDPHTAMWLRDAVERNKLPNLKDMRNPKFFPYRFGQAFWSYVGGKYGDDKIGKMMLAAAHGGNAKSAIQSVLNVAPDALFEDWHSVLRSAYEPVLDSAEPASKQAHALLIAKKGPGSLNVSPALSPDGKHLVMFSERDIFSVELYLVNAETGAIEKKLTETAMNPHFDSMGFIQSAGDWSPDGRKFVFTTLVTGRPRLDIYSMDRGDVTHEIKLNKSLGEIFNPTWSPDGKKIAFAAISGGFTDLYVVDVASGHLRHLTHDPYADLEPSWSPSGRTLAFVTDRFGANLDRLSYGPYRLALFDMDSSKITALPSAATGKQINPQWGADDNTLFFVGNPDGVSNVYRLDIAQGTITKWSNLATGVAGITHLSPAISVASKAHRLAFSDFEGGRYSIYSLDTSRQPRLAASAKLRYDQVAILPPAKRISNTVEASLERPRVGLRPMSGFETHPYHPSLSLDYVAAPGIAVGVGSYGALVGGGTALYWSDLLGQHQLMTSIQTTSLGGGHILRNLGGTVAYENRKSRWTWGFVGGQNPYIAGSYGQVVSSTNGEPVLVNDSVTYWQIDRQVGGLLAYPFSRAQRVEFGMGYRNIAFKAEERLDAYYLSDGTYVGSAKRDLNTPNSINMGTASAALVYDTSIFGGTSPVWGQSYRLEFDANGGGLNFTTALADYRRYFRLPGNLTLAGRLMHYGRYGGDAEDSRLQSLYIGYPSLVRGYDVNSFSTDECGPSLQQQGSCPAFDQLLGSRMAVGNAELRVPILGALGVVPSRGFPPVEVAPFFDAGVAWHSHANPSFINGRARDLVRSYGVSLRGKRPRFPGVPGQLRPPDGPPPQRQLLGVQLSAGLLSLG